MTKEEFLEEAWQHIQPYIGHDEELKEMCTHCENCEGCTGLCGSRNLNMTKKGECKNVDN